MGVLEEEFHEAEELEDGVHRAARAGRETGLAEHAAELEIQDAVFMSSYIPRSLHEVDNVEERQSRIQEEQREGGTGTAYAIAVTHMLKPDTDKASSSCRKLASRGTSFGLVSDLPKASQDPRPDSKARRVALEIVAEEAMCDNDRDAHGGIDGDDNRGDGLGEEREGGTCGASSDEGDDSEFYSGSESEAAEGDERTRRGWSERRARLRKDGMHGRRLPPPEAQEERASAKAEKREVGRCRKNCTLKLALKYSREGLW